MHKKTINPFFLFFFIISILYYSCTTTKNENLTNLPIKNIVDKTEKVHTTSPLTKMRAPLILTFCGDLMCHTENAQTKDFLEIYKDITPIIMEDSFTFANLETPVNDDLPYATYPNFNVHSDYVNAAIQSGIDVFSLANNHTNDGNTKSILKTASYFDSLKNNGIYSAGIHTGKSINSQPAFKDDGLTFQILEKNGWRILFASYTQIVNRQTGLDYIDYYPNTSKDNTRLKQQLIKLSNTFEHDIFIVSVHCDEPEYIIDVPLSSKKWYAELRECGVDIIWANHPHVLQEWEIYTDKKTGNAKSVVMYSLGNLISGQRRPWPDIENPEAKYEYTGDSVLMQITIADNINNYLSNEEKNITQNEEKDFIIRNVKPIYITTHITKWGGDYLIKLLTPAFIASMPKSLQEYYTKRLELIKQIKGITICQ
ncbi:MAG: hypothetical protein BKP49_09010 [Treponema sp. CETP13]|nr:MAG: hypothetical protein BKP49_09010 [Treponema sp. CETP13]